MFPPKARAGVGMVQCVPARYGKPPSRKTIGTMRSAGPNREGLKEGALFCRQQCSEEQW